MRCFGKQMTAQMLDKLRESEVKAVVVQTQEENKASRRILEVNGLALNGDDYFLELER
jgi:predicted acetyltransferase